MIEQQPMIIDPIDSLSYGDAKSGSWTAPPVAGLAICLAVTGHWGWCIMTEHHRFNGTIKPTPWPLAKTRLINEITSFLPADAVIHVRVGRRLDISCRFRARFTTLSRRAAPNAAHPLRREFERREGQRADALADLALNWLTVRWPAQIITPYQHVITPPSGYYPFDLATDGSRREDGLISWAYVTGAGLAGAGHGFASALNGSNQLAEMAAVVNGLATYADGARVNLYLDEQLLANLITRIVEAGTSHGLFPDTTWMTRHHFDLLGNHLRRLHVSATHVNRRTHLLHNRADNLARRTTQAAPSHILDPVPEGRKASENTLDTP